MSLFTEERIFRRVGGVELSLYLVRPDARGLSRPGVVFFHGGSWRGGHPFSFLPHCHYFASRGMVAISASHRLLDSQTTDVRDCIADAEAAVRWLRGLDGVDPSKVVAGGFSSGGHLAACAGLLPPQEVSPVSSRPDAMVLLNPVTQVVRPRDFAMIEEVSPIARVAPGAPPTLIVYGSRDFLRPTILWFGEALRAVGNRCDVVALDGAHTVVHPPSRKRDAYVDAVRPIDDFLVSLGLIEGGVDVGASVDALDFLEILGGRSESVDPAKTRPRRSRPS